LRVIIHLDLLAVRRSVNVPRQFRHGRIESCVAVYPFYQNRPMCRPAFKLIGLGAWILARKRNLIAFKGPVAKSYERGAPRSDPDWDLTGSVFSISEHSVGISWPPPAQPGAAWLVAAVVAPDERSAERAAVVAEAPDEAVAQPLGAAEARALPPAVLDAAAVVQPGAVAQPAEFAASARRAEWALQLLQRVWIAAVAVAVEPRLASAPFPE
jgi:hypothetical protein